MFNTLLYVAVVLPAGNPNGSVAEEALQPPLRSFRIWSSDCISPYYGDTLQWPDSVLNSIEEHCHLRRHSFTRCPISWRYFLLFELAQLPYKLSSSVDNGHDGEYQGISWHVMEYHGTRRHASMDSSWNFSFMTVVYQAFAKIFSKDCLSSSLIMSSQCSDLSCLSVCPTARVRSQPAPMYHP